MMYAQDPQSALSGVLYAEDFDEPFLHIGLPVQDPHPAVLEPELIEPRFSLDELREATEQARADGRDAERCAAALSLETRREAALATLGEQMAITRQHCTHRVEQALDAIAATTLSMLAASLPALCTIHAQDELRAVLHRVLPPTRQLPELHIRVHPSLRKAVESETGALLEGAGTHVSWTDSAKLLPGDITISWQNGTAVRDTAATCAVIRDAVLALFDNGNGSLGPELEDGQ